MLKTEHQIIENMKQERKGKTTIITAHRLSAIVHAGFDSSKVENGQIKERGNHEELMAQKGWYYETYRAQLSEEMEGKLNEKSGSML